MEARQFPIDLRERRESLVRPGCLPCVL